MHWLDELLMTYLFKNCHR